MIDALLICRTCRYALGFAETHEDIKKGQTILQLGVGGGIKAGCNVRAVSLPVLGTVRLILQPGVTSINAKCHAGSMLGPDVLHHFVHRFKLQLRWMSMHTCMQSSQFIVQ